MQAFVKLSEQTEVRVAELETRLKREVSKRDAIILNERENHRKQKLQLNGEISSFERKQAEIVARVELGYEQKLAQEALYLDRMRQVSHTTSSPRYNLSLPFTMIRFLLISAWLACFAILFFPLFVSLFSSQSIALVIFSS